MEHATPEAMEKYLKEHKDADPKNHTVKKTEKDDDGGEDKPSAKKVLQQFDSEYKQVKKQLLDEFGQDLGKQIKDFLSDRIEQGNVPKDKKEFKHQVYVAVYYRNMSRGTTKGDKKDSMALAQKFVDKLDF